MQVANAARDFVVRRQAHRAHPGSPKLIKIADKSCNVRDIVHSPPHDWDAKRISEYLEWASQVVDGCRGVNENLERYFDETLARALDVAVPVASGAATPPA